jgi:hypothetical protein
MQSVILLPGDRPGEAEIRADERQIPHVNPAIAVGVGGLHGGRAIEVGCHQRGGLHINHVFEIGVTRDQEGRR